MTVQIDFRLIVAFQQRPELFQAARNNNHKYFACNCRNKDTKLRVNHYQESMYEAWGDLRYAFPTLERQLSKLEAVWDSYDDNYADTGGCDGGRS